MYKKYKDAPTLCLVKRPLTLLHSERPKLYGVLAVLSAVGLTCILCLWPRHCRNVAKSKNHKTSGCTTFGRKQFRRRDVSLNTTIRRCDISSNTTIRRLRQSVEISSKNVEISSTNSVHQNMHSKYRRLRHFSQARLVACQ